MNNNQIILKEGYLKIAIVLTIAIFFNLLVCDFLGYIGYILTLVLIYVYRNPKRHIYRNSNSILSPVDGTIEAIDFQDGMQKIYIKVSLCDAHKVIAPLDAQVKVKKYQHGLNLKPNSHKASLLNEQMIVLFNDLELKFISGICNTDIKMITKEQVSQGEQIGLFLDGIVIITVNNKQNIQVKIGDKIKYGEEIINI